MISAGSIYLPRSKETREKGALQLFPIDKFSSSSLVEVSQGGRDDLE